MRVDQSTGRDTRGLAIVAGPLPLSSVVCRVNCPGTESRCNYLRSNQERPQILRAGEKGGKIGVGTDWATRPTPALSETMVRTHQPVPRAMTSFENSKRNVGRGGIFYSGRRKAEVQ